MLFVLPEVFTLVLGPSFDLPCLLATAILDSFSLFYLPNSSDCKEFACNAGNLGGEDLHEKEMATHPSTLAQMIPWTEQLVNYSPWGHKESDRTQRLWCISLNFQISLKMTTYLLEICVCIEFTNNLERNWHAYTCLSLQIWIFQYIHEHNISCTYLDLSYSLYFCCCCWLILLTSVLGTILDSPNRHFCFVFYFKNCPLGQVSRVFLVCLTSLYNLTDFWLFFL